MLNQKFVNAQRHRVVEEWIAKARALGLEVTERQARKALRGEGSLRERIEQAEWERALGVGKEAA